MKKLTTLFFTCLITLCCTKLSAQVKYQTYFNSYVTKTYKIDLDTNNTQLYIEALSLDRLHDKGGIMLNKERTAEFINSLKEAKLKYIEWVKTAKDNNVLDLDKPMSIKSIAGSYFYYGSNWHFQFDVKLTYRFKILQSKGETNHLLLINTGELTSSSNQYMKVDGFVLVFTSVEEIDNFINVISPDSITKFLSKPKAADLFKD